MKLKHQYVFGLIGLVFTAFGSGMLFLSITLGIPSITIINATALIMIGLGFAIMIKFLSTIKKIDIYIEDAEN